MSGDIFLATDDRRHEVVPNCRMCGHKEHKVPCVFRGAFIYKRQILEGVCPCEIGKSNG